MPNSRDFDPRILPPLPLCEILPTTFHAGALIAPAISFQVTPLSQLLDLAHYPGKLDAPGRADPLGPRTLRAAACYVIYYVF
jgi:hypothetical protein